MSITQLTKGTLNCKHSFEYYDRVISDYDLELPKEYTTSWSVEQQSRVIESMYFSIPTETIVRWKPLRSQYKQGEHPVVIAGKDVVKAISDYDLSKFAITGLTWAPELNDLNRNQIYEKADSEPGFRLIINRIESNSRISVITITTGWYVSDEDNEEWIDLLEEAYRDIDLVVEEEKDNQPKRRRKNRRKQRKLECEEG
ncbi:MAG: hypothetical protein F6K55_03405 [Moorea sp. SIO4A3]|nr:hypothetical protein [Moorena sp. SIO4A3]